MICCRINSASFRAKSLSTKNISMFSTSFWHFSASIRRVLSITSFALLSITNSVYAVDSVLAGGEDFIAEVAGQLSDIDTSMLRELIEREPDLVIIDVRMSEEIARMGGTIDSGRRDLNINRGWLEFRIGDAVPDLTTPVVVFCGTNQRSPLAAATLARMGYENVSNYSDGFFAWRDAQLPVTQADEAVGTMLFREPVEVIPNLLWSAIGATAPPTFENSGHNNNLSFIITSEGVIVVNAGDNALLAEALHREIRKHTDQPVRYVILENGQGHAMLGSGYWQAQGATIIAHTDAALEIEERGVEILTRMRQRNRDKAMGTKLVMPDETFDDSRIIELGGERVELLHLGPAHSPGDIVVWLPAHETVIAGDMAFHQRLLPVFEDTGTAAWIDTWESFAALGASRVIPGHGEPTNMQEVTKWTVGYLTYMREQISNILDNGGGLIDAYKIDQSAYRHLDTFDELAGLNSDRIFREMEFE